jgi:hypothetical protein
MKFTRGSLPKPVGGGSTEPVTLSIPAPPMGLRRALGATLIVVACSLAGASADAGRSRPAGPITVFLAKRPTLEVKLWVDPWGVVFTRTSSLVRCGRRGSKEYGSITSRPWRHFPVLADGSFERGVEEAYEGSGWYFTGLEGRVRPNVVVGEYRAWEERTGEEEFFPRCGTRSFRGEPMRFRARRVAGPRWRSRR